jgi:hypothetical protein
MKNETIEQAAEKYSMELLEAKTIQPHEKSWVESIFAQGAKKQTERSYSEEEQLHLLNEYNEYLFSFIDKDEVGIGVEKEDVVKWFEQFKKK